MSGICEKGDHMKKMMIISYYMLPFCESFGACQRMYYLASEAVARDYEVKVIHVLTGKQSKKEHELPFTSLPIAFKNHVFERAFGSEVMMSADRNSSNQPLSIGALVHHLSKGLLKITNRFFFNEPLPGIGIAAYEWSIHAKKMILSEISNSQIGVVIISGPPFSLFRLARIIKKTFPGVKVVLDYRDPWNVWNGRSGIPWAKERRVLNCADKTIFASKDLCDYFRDRNLLSIEKSAVISNGYSESLWRKVEANHSQDRQGGKRKPLMLSHVGSLRLGAKGKTRDTSVLLEVISNNQTLDLNIRFVGATGILQAHDRRVEVIPRVSQSQSLEYMLDSDVLIVMHTAKDDSGKFINTGKFFDYIRSGRVIWGIGNENVFFNKMIKDHSLGVTSENDYESISATIGLLYKRHLAGELRALRNQMMVGFEYSRENLNKKYLSIVDELIENGPGY